jgi:hypothetical protein
MIDLVLATDMKQHFALLGQFQNAKQPAIGGSRAHSAAGDWKEQAKADEKGQRQEQSQKPAAEQDITLSLQVCSFLLTYGISSHMLAFVIFLWASIRGLLLLVTISLFLTFDWLIGCPSIGHMHTLQKSHVAFCSV